MWVAEDDDLRVRWLAENGFARQAEFRHLFQVPLAGALAWPPRTRPSARPRRSTAPFDRYFARTLRFMQSPVCEKEHELFIVMPGDEVAAFCCIWTDEVNRAGYCEPVGVHPAHHRQALERGLLLEGFRRFRAVG